MYRTQARYTINQFWFENSVFAFQCILLILHCVLFENYHKDGRLYETDWSMYMRKVRRDLSTLAKYPFLNAPVRL